MIVDSFDNWAPSYDDSALQPAYEAAHDAVLCRVQRLITRPRRVLDVGCGTGKLLRTASSLFPAATLIGLDASRVMLSVAAGATGEAGAAGATGEAGAAGGQAAGVQGAAEDLPFGDEVFDVVTSTVSFRHWADQAAGMCEIGRVLVPGGLLGFADVFKARRHARGIGRRMALVPATLRDGLAAAGLSVISVHSVNGFGPITAITVLMARRRRRGKHRGFEVQIPF